MKQKIYDFFENPQSKWAIGINLFIFFLIFVSGGLVILQWVRPDLTEPFASKINLIEYFILGVFTLEYLIRFLTAPKIGKFVFDKFNLIDLFVILPFYLGIQNTILLRMLRLARFLKFFKYLSIFKIFKYKGTIFEKIMPLLLFFLLLKSGIWLLEYQNLWIVKQELGELFAIIGFSLGIVLSQKIATTQEKYLNIEEAFFRLRGNLFALVEIFEIQKKGSGKSAVKRWLASFLEHLETENSAITKMDPANIELYKAMQNLEKELAEMALFFKEICSETHFIFGKKMSTTPSVYDNLLQQATIFYCLMIVIFIGGVTGMISVLAATYLLYGMFHVTLDFDSIIGGDFDLINVDRSDLHCFLKTLKA